MKINNEMSLTFKALSINESFARASVSAFCLQANPSLDEITDIKTAVSEAVTNAVVHAYPKKPGDITIRVVLNAENIYISVTDYGVGVDDLGKIREPFYTTKPDQERSGMGFTVMESFMDDVQLEKNTTRGLTVKMTKNIRSGYSYLMEG